MSKHYDGCRCPTCGNPAKNFISVYKDIGECDSCHNWYKSNPDGTIRFPNVREALEAGVGRQKQQELAKQGQPYEKCSVTLKDIDNPNYAVNATVDAMEKSDKGHELREAIHIEKKYLKEHIQAVEHGKDID